MIAAALRRGHRIVCATVLLSAVAAGSTTAQPAAQGAVSTPRFGQPGAPIDVSADSTQVFQTERRIVYKGSVEALQGTTRLRTPQLTIFYNNNNAVKGPAGASPAGGGVGALSRMEAEGPVYFVTPTQSAKGDHGTFDATNDTITLSGNVTLLQDKNVATGDRLVMNQKTGEVTLTGGGTKGRVRGVFYSNDKPSAPGGQD